MKTKSLLLFFVIFIALSSSALSQTRTGTLKIFSEQPGVVVFLDEVKQADNIQQINDVPIGSHYLKVLSKDGAKVYSSIVNVNENSVTTVLIPNAAPAQEAPVNNLPAKEIPKNPAQTQGPAKTGTLKIFSELTGITVYLDDNKQGDDIKQINSVPVGSHYLKVLKDGTSIYGELVNITENEVTTVLVQNNGQVQEKILNNKVPEQDEYKNSKLDVIMSNGTQTSTKGYSTLYPGYYSYWGTSSSVSNTVQTTDWKIIQGGVKEISEYNFATLTGNTALQQSISAQLAKEQKLTSTGAFMFLGAFIPTAIIFADILVKKPFLHKVGTTAPNWEVGVAATGIVVCTIGYAITMKKPYSGHYTTVDNAAKDAQQYNRKLKSKLGLPESYDTGK